MNAKNINASKPLPEYVTRFSNDVKEFVQSMMPLPGVAGVDLDSPAYRDMLTEAENDGTIKPGYRSGFDSDVRSLIVVCGQRGFSVLDFTHAEPAPDITGQPSPYSS